MACLGISTGRKVIGMAIPVFYVPSMSVADNPSFSPSAGKPQRLVEYWQKQGLPISLWQFGPLDRKQLWEAHDPRYVDDILGCCLNNGFGNRSEAVAQSLPYTSASMFEAARHALTYKRNTCSPTSGFHHAGYQSASGFCTFNGLMVTAINLKKLGLASRIGILDCDQHYGNGTSEIIHRLHIDYVTHWTYGALYHCKIDVPSWKGGSVAKDFFPRLKTVLEDFKGCDVLLYQAGADPHVDDPYGGTLTTDELRERDRIVFQWGKANNVPIAWNLAGGYQEPLQKVLDIHTNTLLEAITVGGLTNKIPYD